MAFDVNGLNYCVACNSTGGHKEHCPCFVKPEVKNTDKIAALEADINSFSELLKGVEEDVKEYDWGELHYYAVSFYEAARGHLEQLKEGDVLLTDLATEVRLIFGAHHDSNDFQEMYRIKRNCKTTMQALASLLCRRLEALTPKGANNG